MTEYKLFDRLIYSTELDAEKDNPFKCKKCKLDGTYCPITEA